MRESILTLKTLRLFAIGVLLLPLGFADLANGQRRLQGNSSSTILEAGTAIPVRTTEAIEADESDGRVYLGVVDQDVADRNGRVSIPKGSDVELVVRNISDNELAVDLEAITISDRRYGLTTEGTTVTSEDKKGIGVNKRTGKYVGGGAVIGAIIGGITGGGKGAAIGAGAGAAAGAGAQVLTRGREVKIPAESLLTFRLQQPMRTPALDTGFTREGTHYHVYDDISTTSAAYRAGLQAGRSDRERNRPRDMYSERWTTAQQRRDYEAGYSRGFEGRNVSTAARASVNIGNDNRITWDATEPVRVWVQVDSNRRQLFAEGQSGAQLAPWIKRGHTYLFIVEDMNGNELTRDRLDLR